VGAETYLVPTDDHPEVQALAWPRSTYSCGVTKDLGVPSAIKDAQGFLVLNIAQGVDVLPTTGAAALVKKKKVGDLEVEYFEAGLLALKGPYIAAVEGYLFPYMRVNQPSGQGFMVSRG
jgi:hypothetical protein